MNAVENLGKIGKHLLRATIGDSSYCVRCSAVVTEDLYDHPCLGSDPELIDLPLMEAQSIKFEWGRQRYGTNEFVGDPLVELFEECLDAIAYCDELLKRGYLVGLLRTEFLSAALQCQTIRASERKMRKR